MSPSQKGKKLLNDVKGAYSQHVRGNIQSGLYKLLQMADKTLYPLVPKELPEVQVVPGSGNSVQQSALDEVMKKILDTKAHSLNRPLDLAERRWMHDVHARDPEIYLEAAKIGNKNAITPGSESRQFPLFQTASGLVNLFDPLGEKDLALSQLKFGLHYLLNPPLQKSWDPAYAMGRYEPHLHPPGSIDPPRPPTL